MGMIKYHKRLKQLYDFEGMGKGKISPTDIDAVLEFGNKFLFLFEFKLEGKEKEQPILGIKSLMILQQW